MTANDLWDAGYAILTINIMSDSQNWRYRDEKFKTRYIEVEKHENPDVWIAPIDRVRSNALV